MEVAVASVATKYGALTKRLLLRMPLVTNVPSIVVLAALSSPFTVNKSVSNEIDRLLIDSMVSSV